MNIIIVVVILLDRTAVRQTAVYIKKKVTRNAHLHFISEYLMLL